MIEIQTLEDIRIRRQSLRGAIANFNRSLASHEKKAAELRSWIAEAKSELLTWIEAEDIALTEASADQQGFTG